MECCICYESSGIYNTECSHNLCLDCLLELKKLECPICRNQLNKIPFKIKKLIEKGEAYENELEEMTKKCEQIKDLNEFHKFFKDDIKIGVMSMSSIRKWFLLDVEKVFISKLIFTNFC